MAPDALAAVPAGSGYAAARVRVLFLSTLLPGALSSGSEVATQAFADGLRAIGHDVVLVAYRRSGSSPPTGADDVAVADRHIETDAAGVRPALWMARALVTRRPYSVAKYVSRAYARAVGDELRRVRPELVVVDHAQMAWAAPPLPYVYLAHNVEHRLYAELAAAGGLRGRASRREATLIQRTEEALCRDARAVWALTAEDAESLARMGARSEHFDLPPAHEPASPGSPACDVAVLGTWTWRANAAGLEWFLREVRPLLPAGIPVEVGGAGSEEIAAGTVGVNARGRVADAMRFLQSAKVVAVPSVAGAGVQVKTLDAIAAGRRVVATPTALRGISGAPPSVVVAADAAGFAAALTDAIEAGSGPEIERDVKRWVADRRARFTDRLRTCVEAVASAG